MVQYFSADCCHPTNDARGSTIGNIDTDANPGKCHDVHCYRECEHGRTGGRMRDPQGTARNYSTYSHILYSWDMIDARRTLIICLTRSCMSGKGR
jgi:hypothetical protein